MRTFRQHLAENLKDREFREKYQEERQLLEMAFKIMDARRDSGLSQKELAHRAQITQQQLSRIENGVNCHLLTFLRVCQALGMTLELGTAAK